MSLATLWNDTTPSTRCEWVDQLRGWALIVMMEVHCVNVWLHRGLAPDWLHYLNGLVAPSFLMCAGFSLVLSTFRSDGTLRPFKDSAGRLGVILLCAYALHAPGFTLAEWTVLATPQKLRELFKIDVLQCIVFSLLILQALARILRRPRLFAFVALGLAVYVGLVAPYAWATGVGDGLWLPIRGLLNGNPDRGVQALFPLLPWFAFPAFGAFLGGMYRITRVEKREGAARWSEARWLLALFILGLLLCLGGHHWAWKGRLLPVNGVPLYDGHWNETEWWRIQNATLPSIAARLGWICMAGSLMGFVEKLRPRWKGLNPIANASRESLLIYMLHLYLIFSVMLAQPFLGWTGWDWYTLGWAGTLAITAGVIALNVAVGLTWQWADTLEGLKPRILRAAGAVLALWFLAGGWWTFRFIVLSPELAREPYAFLNAARAKKGLPPTPDGLSRNPEEAFREAARRRMKVTEAFRAEVLRLTAARQEADRMRPGS